MKPDIALTLETMGVELKGVTTTLDLEGALELLGVSDPKRVTRTPTKTTHVARPTRRAGARVRRPWKRGAEREGLDERRDASPDRAGARPEGDLMSSIAEILRALAAVARGELQQRLVPKYEDTHPVGALALSVNVMIEALAEAQDKTAAYQRSSRSRSSRSRSSTWRSGSCRRRSSRSGRASCACPSSACSTARGPRR